MRNMNIKKEHEIKIETWECGHAESEIKGVSG